MTRSFFLILTLFICWESPAQLLGEKKLPTRQDTLRGTVTAERAWWDVQRYDIEVTPDFNARMITGTVQMAFTVGTNDQREVMQIDLQEPMQINTILLDQKTPITIDKNHVYREGNVYHIRMPSLKKNTTHTIAFAFSGIPRPAMNAPWDGGWIWKKDDKGRPWVSVAVQGLGASAWFPCKDHQGDEPDKGASLKMIVPDTLVAIGNGKLTSKSSSGGKASFTWEVRNPINNYNIIPYIGKYVNFTETFIGEKGKLNCSYWVLDYNLEKAKEQFKQAPMTLKSLEHWFGPYPFYEDDYKLVESPHLGMEHQSAVAYGNKYANGYLGKDLSGTGVGKKWDFIIVHETGHEWFGNNITAADIADMWLHEGFTSYSEVLHTEFHFGKEDANAYVQGIRRLIANKETLIGEYGVNMEGSSDMYYKGSNLLHTIRQVINDDIRFRDILRGLNALYYHKTVSTADVESYMIRQSDKDLSKIFDQYLRHTKIPLLKLDVDGSELKYKWEDQVQGFNMPVRLTSNQWITPSDDWQSIPIDPAVAKELTADPNFYIRVRKDD